MKSFDLYEGIQIIDDQIHFNYDSDDHEKDILYLHQDTSGQFTEEGVSYVYGYEYSPNSSLSEQKILRDYLKSNILGNDDVFDFIENGILRLDRVKDLNSFGCFVSTASSKSPSLVDEILLQLSNYVTLYYSFKLIKETYEHVNFDEEKAREALRNSGRVKTKTQEDKLIQKFIDHFNELKKSGCLFEMKRINPTVLRSSLSNFLKFNSSDEEEVYRSLDGIKVLLFDDFLTSGSTIKEMIRILKSINPNNTLTVFVLINQKRG